MSRTVQLDRTCPSPARQHARADRRRRVGRRAFASWAPRDPTGYGSSRRPVPPPPGPLPRACRRRGEARRRNVRSGWSRSSPSEVKRSATRHRDRVEVDEVPCLSPLQRLAHRRSSSREDGNDECEPASGRGWAAPSRGTDHSWAASSSTAATTRRSAPHESHLVQILDARGPIRDYAPGVPDVALRLERTEALELLAVVQATLNAIARSQELTVGAAILTGIKAKLIDALEAG